jgi:hypothetical protein
MSKSRFMVLPLPKPPAGFSDKFGILDSLDGSFKPIIFFTKKSWPDVLAQVDLSEEEQLNRGKEVMASGLEESNPLLDGVARQSRAPLSGYKM